MRELLGATKRGQSSSLETASSSLLRVTGSGRALGILKKTLSSKIERDGATLMTSMALSKGQEGYLIL